MIEHSPDVVFRRLGDRMVLIHLNTNDIFDLNDTAARLWELLGAIHDAPGLIEALSVEYDVGSEQVRSEVSAMLSTFADHELIRGYESE
jgi:hypothetical protein